MTVVGRPVRRDAGPGRGLPALPRRGRPPAHEPRPRPVASELLRTYAPTICVQMPAGLAARPRRRASPPDGGRHQGAAHPRGRRLHGGGLPDLPDPPPPRGPAVGRPGERRPAAPRGLPPRPAADAHRRGPSGRPTWTRRTRRLKRCASISWPGARPASWRSARSTEENVEAYLEARFPGHRFPPALAPALHARTEGLALFVRSLVDILVGAAGRRPGRRGVDARPAGRGAGPRADQGPAGPGAAPARGARRGRSGRSSRSASVAGREFLSPVVAHLVGREERQVEEDLRRLGRVRRLIVEGGEETLPDGTLATRYRFAHGALPVGAARGPRGVAPARAPPRGRGAPAAPLGRPRRRASPPRSPATARRDATTRGRSPSGGTPATTRPGSSPTPRRRSTTTGPSARSRSCPPRAAPRPRSLSTGGGAPCGSPRRASTTPPPTSRRCSAVARGTGAPRRGAGRAGRPVRHALLRPAGRGDGRPRAGAARRRDPGGRGRRPSPRPTRGSARCSSAEGRFEEAVPLLDEAIASARRVGATVALKIALSYRGARALLADRVRGRRGAQRRGRCRSPRELGDGFYALAARMFLGLARANLGRISEALDDFADADRRGPAQRRPVLAAPPPEPPRLGAPRAGRARARPRARHRGGAARPGATRPGARRPRCSSTCASTTSGRDSAEQASALLARAPGEGGGRARGCAG